MNESRSKGNEGEIKKESGSEWESQDENLDEN